MKIKEILTIKGKSQEVKIKGWVRTRRGSKHVSFIALNDGSTINNMQVIAEGDSFPEEVIRQITTGSCISVEGNLVESKGSGQAVEILANKIEILGRADAEEYPLQPKKHSLEFLREKAHLRFRTNTFSSVFRLRHTLTFAIHKFFHDKGFFNLHSPIITGADAEGAGEMFKVTTLKEDQIDPKGTDYYGAVLESTPMLEPCVDPEVVMKYKLINMPVGTKALPYIGNMTPTSFLGSNSLNSSLVGNPPNWAFNTVVLSPETHGASEAFLNEDYSFLVLNRNVVDIGIGEGSTVDYDVGAVYNEESGRLSKKVVSRVATFKTGIGTVATSRETSIIITGQMSGAIYVLPIKVDYLDNTPQ